MPAWAPRDGVASRFAGLCLILGKQTEGNWNGSLLPLIKTLTCRSIQCRGSCQAWQSSCTAWLVSIVFISSKMCVLLLTLCLVTAACRSMR